MSLIALHCINRRWFWTFAPKFCPPNPFVIDVNMSTQNKPSTPSNRQHLITLTEFGALRTQKMIATPSSQGTRKKVERPTHVPTQLGLSCIKLLPFWPYSHTLTLPFPYQGTGTTTGLLHLIPYPYPIAVIPIMGKVALCIERCGECSAHQPSSCWNTKLKCLKKPYVNAQPFFGLCPGHGLL